MGDISISVVIPTVFRKESLLRLLESIRDQTKQPYEVIIVCSKYPQEDSLSEVVRFFGAGSVKLSFLSADVANVQIQKKLGVEKAACGIICFLDDDVILENNFFLKIEKAFLDFDVDGVQPFIDSFRNDRGIKKLIKKITLLNRSFGEGKIMASGFPQACFQASKPMLVEFMYGTCCYKSSVFKKKNYFNEEIGVTHLWEDVFLSSRIKKDGHSFLYFPEAKVSHFHEPGGRRTRKSFLASYVFNHYLLWEEFVGKKPITRLAFIWAKICYWALFTLQSIKMRNFFETQRGFVLGHKWISRYRKYGLFPRYDEIEIK